MGSVVRYAAVNTKVKVLKGKLLSSEQYKKLIESKNFLDALRYLKEDTYYREALENYNIELLHRGSLEKILKKYYINSFIKLRHYFIGDYRFLFKCLFMRFEIEDLKTIFRGKYAGRSKEEILDLINFRCELTSIDYDNLASATNVEGIIERLKDTHYYKKLVPILENYDEEDGLFRVETTLDFEYFDMIKKAIKKIDEEDSKILQKIIGINCDLLNIQWLYRGKKYFNLSSEELLNYTIYDGYYLNYKDIKALCYTKNFDEFYEFIEKTPYKNVFNPNNTMDHLYEKNILSYLKEFYEGLVKENKLNISVVVCYIELLLIEIRNIVSIVENKRYNIVNEEVVKYVTATLD